MDSSPAKNLTSLSLEMWANCMTGYSSSHDVAPADADSGSGELKIFLPPRFDLLHFACVIVILILYIKLSLILYIKLAFFPLLITWTQVFFFSSLFVGKWCHLSSVTWSTFMNLFWIRLSLLQGFTQHLSPLTIVDSNKKTKWNRTGTNIKIQIWF